MKSTTYLLHDLVLVRRTAEELTSPGGIVLPDAATERPNRGTVLAVGPGKPLDNGKRFPMSLVGGEIILFSKFGPTEVKIDGEDLLLMHEEAVLAVIGRAYPSPRTRRPAKPLALSGELLSG